MEFVADRLVLRLISCEHFAIQGGASVTRTSFRTLRVCSPNVSGQSHNDRLEGYFFTTNGQVICCYRALGTFQTRFQDLCWELVDDVTMQDGRNSTYYPTSIFGTLPFQLRQ